MDDASRLAFTAVLVDERKEHPMTFLDAALAWFQAHCMLAKRIMRPGDGLCGFGMLCVQMSPGEPDLL
jgi:hypothetical protein